MWLQPSWRYLKATIKLHITHLFPEMFINKILLQILFQTYSILWQLCNITEDQFYIIMSASLEIVQILVHKMQISFPTTLSRTAHGPTSLSSQGTWHTIIIFNLSFADVNHTIYMCKVNWVQENAT